MFGDCGMLFSKNGEEDIGKKERRQDGKSNSETHKAPG